MSRAALLRDVGVWGRVCGVRLRSYQLEVARAVVESVRLHQGLSFAVMMCRQAGKNETSAVLESYLMALHSRVGGQIVKASPTYKPQTINSKLRLMERIPEWLRGRGREGYIWEVGRARTLFLSAEPSASVVGATASLLLECDEAQDIDVGKWQRDFLPMAASTMATTVYWGTAWTDRTLLAGMVRRLREEEGRDGRRRVFVIDAEVVGREVESYRGYVADQVGRLGRSHPLVRSQYFLEEVDAAGGLFTEARQALMRGSHARQRAPLGRGVYALLVDVGGPEESAGAVGVERALNARRDATAVTVVEVDLGTVQDPGLRRPTYRVVDRRVWLGVNHAALYGELMALAEVWRPQYVVVDATGVGAGLAAFLGRALGPRVVPVVFSQAVKSKVGWGFVGIVDTGRYKEYAEDGAGETRQFWYEVGACEYEATVGMGLRWGVWEAPRYDGLVARGHDDLLVSAALVAVLDEVASFATGVGAVIEGGDVLEELDRMPF